MHIWPIPMPGAYVWYVTTFCVTFLSMTHHVRIYVLCENRSSIQSLVLMCSATSYHFSFCVSVCYLATCTYLNILSCCVRQSEKLTVAVVTTSDMFLFSCRAGQLEIVRILIDKSNCDAQHTDCFGSTPLHYACRYAYSP